MSKQSETLTAFYRLYLEIATTEKVSSRLPGKKGKAGLCHNLSNFMISNNTDVDEYRKILNEMKSQFIEAGLDPLFPFNFDEQDYHKEMHRADAFRNPKRMAWVIEHVK